MLASHPPRNESGSTHTTDVHPTLNDENLRDAHARLGHRRLERIRLLASFHDTVDPLQLGFSHREDFAKQCLGISNRTWQQQTRIWNHLQPLALTRRAYAESIVSESKLLLILEELSPANEQTWLKRAVRLGPAALRQVVLQSKGVCTNVRKDSRPDATGETKAVQLRCPSQTVWATQSFAETVSRRIGHRASSQDIVDVAVGSFLAGLDSEVHSKLRRHVHWPPLFVTESDPRSHNSVPAAPDDLKRPDLDTYVFRNEAEDLESPGPWLSFWKKQAAERGVVEPSPGESGWAFYNGIPDEQTDGRSFITSRLSAITHRKGLWSDHERQRQRSLSQTLRERLERLIDDVAAGSEESSDDTAITEGIREVEASGTREVEAVGPETGAKEAALLGFRQTLNRLHALEAEMRVLSRRRLDCLRQIRKDRSFVRLGFSSFDDYVEDRLGLTARTVHRWLNVPIPSPVMLAAEANPSMRSPILRELQRIERAGADDRSLRRWTERASETTSKDFQKQVEWALAHDDFRPSLTSLRARPRLEPPAPSVWAEVSRRLLRDPAAIRSPEFHERVRLAESSRVEAAIATAATTSSPTADAVRTISAHLTAEGEQTSSARLTSEGGRTISAQLTAEGEQTSSMHLTPEVDRTFSAHPRSTESLAETPATNSAPSSTNWIGDCPPLPIPIPDPESPTSTHLCLHIAPETQDNLARVFAVLRAQYGDDKPDWWCLEVLFLHVHAGWTDEDADFRRRTAEFSTLARDGFQCQNPYCTARRNLTAHHIVFRSANGSDEDWNKITLCAACHLQGIHTVASIKVTGTAPDKLTWRLGRAPLTTVVPTVVPKVVPPLEPRPAHERPC